MAAAMVEGLIAKGAYAPGKIACMGGAGRAAPPSPSARASGSRPRSRTSWRGADTLVVAFKPQHLASA